MGNRPQLWTPEPCGFTWEGDTLDEITQAYSLFLEVCHPAHLVAFKERLTAEPAAARAEAAVFSWLSSARLAPALNEDRSRGGMDFLCLPGQTDSFLLEVTSLRKEAITAKSGWPEQLTEEAAAFSMVTPQISRSIQHKMPQLAASPASVARVLAICLSHPGASALLSTLAAEWVITSPPALRSVIPKDGAPAGDPQMVTNLKQSAFFCIKEGRIEPARQCLSAILLVAVWDRQLEISGMLHPAATKPFAYRLLRGVPFLRVDWPIIDGQINTEWVIGDPAPLAHHHSRVSLTDAELKPAL
jgi:hypothetical protein